jgi:peptide/nickel transport system substrate-binding protein
MKKLLVPLVLLLVLASVFTACSSSPSTTTTSANPPGSSAVTTTSAESAKYGGTFIMVRKTGIPDIGAPSDIPSQTNTPSLVTPVLEHLITTDANERIQPWLAESVETSADGKKITFKLLKGVKFQDGTDFNAAAVKFNLELVLKNNCNASGILKKVASYNIVDDYTLEVNLTEYDARFLQTLAQTGIAQIASPTALQKSEDHASHIVGTGPFKFDSWQVEQYVKMVKWDGYRTKGRPYLDAIEIRNSSDTTVSLMSMKAGEVNMVEDIDPADYISLQKEGYSAAIAPIGFVFSFVPDSANPDSPFKDPRVRQALEYAIDKDAMAKGLGKGTQFPAYQCAVEPPMGQDAWYLPEVAPRKFDIAKAKALLTDAGYPNGFDCALTTDVRARQDTIVALQTYFKGIGINTTLDMADVGRASTFPKDGWKGILVGGFPNFSSFTQWVTAFNDPTFVYPSALKPEGWKEAWDAVVKETDYDKRMTLMRDILKKNYEGAYRIAYLEDGPRYVTDGKVQDLNFDGHHINGYQDSVNVYLKKK